MGCHCPGLQEFFERDYGKVKEIARGYRTEPL